MDVQLTREEIRLEQPLGKGHSTGVVTGEVTLPGSLREETRVLGALADAQVEQAEVTRDRVNVRGRVMFRVLYLRGEGGEPVAIEASADFMQPVLIQGVQAGAAAQAMARVQRVEARASGGRMNLRAEIAVDASACDTQPVEAINAVEGTDCVETMVRQGKACTRVAQGACDMVLQEELPLPAELQIRQTLFATAFPVVEEITGGTGRVGVAGHVLLEAVHTSDLPARPLVTTRHSIPFAKGVETGGEGGTLDGSAMVRDVAVASQADGDGTTLRAEVVLGLETSVDAVQTLSVLQDAYTTGGAEILLSGQDVRLRTGRERCNAAESGKATVRLPEGAPPVRTVLAAFMQPIWDACEAQGARTAVSGQLAGTLVYMTDGSDAPVSIRFSEPFRTTFNAALRGDALMNLTATECEATPVTSDRVEVRCVLRMDAVFDEEDTLRLLTEGQVVEESAPPVDDMVLCFVQPGERLWDIARRYRVPVEGVRALNPELQGEVVPGQGVLVWRHPAQA